MRPKTITNRDKELLGYLTQGYTNKEIAEMEERSVCTIADAFVKLNAKLSAKNRTELVAKALKMGIIE